MDPDPLSYHHAYGDRHWYSRVLVRAVARLAEPDADALVGLLAMEPARARVELLVTQEGLHNVLLLDHRP